MCIPIWQLWLAPSHVAYFKSRSSFCIGEILCIKKGRSWSPFLKSKGLDHFLDNDPWDFSKGKCVARQSRNIGFLKYMGKVEIESLGLSLS